MHPGPALAPLHPWDGLGLPSVPGTPAGVVGQVLAPGSDLRNTMGSRHCSLPSPSLLLACAMLVVAKRNHTMFFWVFLKSDTFRLVSDRRPNEVSSMHLKQEGVLLLVNQNNALANYILKLITFLLLYFLQM